MRYELFHTSYLTILSSPFYSVAINLHEGFSSFRCAFVYTGIFQNAYKYMSNSSLEDIHHIISLFSSGCFWQEGFYPVRMFFQSFVGTDVFFSMI